MTTRAADGFDACDHEFGADQVASVSLDAVDAQLAQWPARPLLRELEAVVAAVEASDPARLRRRSGLWGRLLGRDLVELAQPDPVSTRVRLGLATAQSLADELGVRSVALERAAATLQQRADHLAALIADERERLAGSAEVAEATANERLLARVRRLDHLAAIVASWRSSVAHIALVRSQAAQLLVRHAQVRDLMASLWRERASADAMSAQLDPAGITCLHASLLDLANDIAAETLSTPPAPPAAEPHPPIKEPSP